VDNRVDRMRLYPIKSLIKKHIICLFGAGGGT
jgi:hypothetical protein